MNVFLSLMENLRSFLILNVLFGHVTSHMISFASGHKPLTTFINSSVDVHYDEACTCVFIDLR